MLSRKTSPTHSWSSDLVFLGLILFVFYFFYLGSYPLFTPDEGRYSEVAREMLASGDFITPRVDGVAFLDKPILYYWLQALAMGVFGINEWAVRIFPALLGIFGCLATYAAGRLLFNRLTGLLSAIILATTPLYFGGAHYADLNLEVGVWISATLLSFITATQSRGPLRSQLFFGAYVFAALAFLTKGLIGIAFPGLIAGSWILLLNRWSVLKKMHLIFGILLFIGLTLPWYVLVQKANPEFLHYFFVTQQVTRFLSAAEFNNKTPIWFYLPIILIGAFPWTIFLVQALNEKLRAVWQSRQDHPVELFLLLWLGIIFIFFSIPHSKTVGYILPVFPAIALLIGNYLAQLWQASSEKAVFIVSLLFALISTLLALVIFFLPSHIWIDLAPGFRPFAMAIAWSFIISAQLAFIIAKQKKIKNLIYLFTACSIVFLITLIAGAKYINTNSAKPVVTNLQTIIQPEDEVATYFRYYQDIPLYLKRRVTIVADWQSPNIIYKDNWVRELWNGMAFQKTDDWLINQDTFWQRFDDNKKRMFVFINSNYFDDFKQHAKTYFLIDKHNDIILVSNQPTIVNN